MRRIFFLDCTTSCVAGITPPPRAAKPFGDKPSSFSLFFPRVIPSSKLETPRFPSPLTRRKKSFLCRDPISGARIWFSLPSHVPPPSVRPMLTSRRSFFFPSSPQKKLQSIRFPALFNCAEPGPFCQKCPFSNHDFSLPLWFRALNGTDLQKSLGWMRVDASVPCLPFTEVIVVVFFIR